MKTPEVIEPHDSTVRTLLPILEKKGYVRILGQPAGRLRGYRIKALGCAD